MKKALAVLFTFLLLFSVVTVVRVSGGGRGWELGPDEFTVKKGSQASLPVDFWGGTEFKSFRIKITYNPQMVTIDSVSKNQLLSGNFNYSINESNGLLDIVYKGTKAIKNDGIGDEADIFTIIVNISNNLSDYTTLEFNLITEDTVYPDGSHAEYYDEYHIHKMYLVEEEGTRPTIRPTGITTTRTKTTKKTDQTDPTSGIPETSTVSSDTSTIFNIILKTLSKAIEYAKVLLPVIVRLFKNMISYLSSLRA